MKGGIVVICVAYLIVVTTATSCSEGTRRTNLQQCLQDIRAAGNNNSAFWFGTEYSTTCPNGIDGTFGCMNRDPTAQTLFQRMQLSPGFDPSVIDRFLKVEFTSPPGSYDGCDQSETINTTWNQDIDPISGLVASPWKTRFLPYLQWTTQPGDVYTLIVYDAGFGPMHGVYTNINGNDISRATATLPYRGPGNLSLNGNPYVFLLFKQTGQLSVPASFANSSRSVSLKNFTQLMRDWNLSGPVAVNWIRVKGDIYAIGRAQKSNFNNCPVLLQEDIRNKMHPSYLPRSTKLELSVEVTYQPKSIEFYACCSKHTYSQETFNLNPIGNPVYDTYKISQAPKVSFQKRGPLAQASFTGEIYTLIMVDADIANPIVGNTTHPLVFWLVTNIREGNMSTGEQYVNYLGPQPRNRVPHRYYFLVYKQTAVLPVSTYFPYTSHCANPLGRCLLNIDGLVSDKNLKLVGVSWMRATTDIYVAFERIFTFGRSDSQWCTGMQGYNGDPSCPAGLSTVVHPGVIVG